MSKNLLLNEIYVSEINSRLQKRTTSTLRIPKDKMDEFEVKVDVHGGVERYFRFLLKRFRVFNYCAMIPEASKMKTEYQQEGLGYFRVDFEPSNEDWSELSALAIYYGKSRCWLFTFLFSLDLLGVGELLADTFGGVPSLGTSILFTGMFIQREKGLFTRGMKIKRNNFRETIREKPKLYRPQLVSRGSL
jgi:Protein of unknown function (DUF1564)